MRFHNGRAIVRDINFFVIKLITTYVSDLRVMQNVKNSKISWRWHKIMASIEYIFFLQTIPDY